MDLTALTTRCESRFRDTTNAVISEAQWKDYLNDAYADVHAASDVWPYLEARATNEVTTSGQITLPTNVFRVTAVFNVTDELAMVPLQTRGEYRRWFADQTETGTPLYYRLRSNELELYPTPAVATEVAIDYWVPPADLSAGGDVPAFPAQYHRMLVAGALAYAYEDDGNPQQAEVHRARFERLLSQMKHELLGPRTEGYAEIVDNWGD